MASTSTKKSGLANPATNITVMVGGLGFRLNCSYELTFPIYSTSYQICRGDAVITNGVEQRFEHGIMFWNQQEQKIYVLYITRFPPPLWEVYPDAWTVDQPEFDPTLVPPDGLYQPVRGFGLLWRTHSEIREKLGWAIAPEASYQTAIQTSIPEKYGMNYIFTYIKALNGGTWKLSPMISWEYLP